jgi:hypothetical protein
MKRITQFSHRLHSGFSRLGLCCVGVKKSTSASLHSFNLVITCFHAPLVTPIFCASRVVEMDVEIVDELWKFHVCSIMSCKLRVSLCSSNTTNLLQLKDAYLNLFIATMLCFIFYMYDIRA